MNILDVENINNIGSYTVEIIHEDLYLFRTDNNIIYEIGFPMDNPVGGCDTYQFFINNTNNSRPPHDIKVKQTIMSILEEFFNKNDSVILYVCDTSDSRQRIRRALFERWFNNFSMRKDFVIMSACLVDEGIENYTSIIVKNTNPKLNDIVTDFTDTIKLLNENKP